MSVRWRACGRSCTAAQAASTAFAEPSPSVESVRVTDRPAHGTTWHRPLTKDSVHGPGSASSSPSSRRCWRVLRSWRLEHPAHPSPSSTRCYRHVESCQGVGSMVPFHGGPWPLGRGLGRLHPAVPDDPLATALRSHLQFARPGGSPLRRPLSWSGQHDHCPVRSTLPAGATLRQTRLKGQATGAGAVQAGGTKLLDFTARHPVEGLPGAAPGGAVRSDVNGLMCGSRYRRHTRPMFALPSRLRSVPHAGLPLFSSVRADATPPSRTCAAIAGSARPTSAHQHLANQACSYR